MHLHKLLVRASFLILTLVGLSSCEKPPAPGARHFVMVPKGMHPYYAPCWQGFQDAAKKQGVLVDYVAPAAFDAKEQEQTLRNVLAQHPLGIAISAQGDQELINVINDANAAGVKVITFDAPAPSTAALTYIGTSNPQAGYDAGVALAALMNNEGELAVLQGSMGSTNHNLRFEGLQKALKEKAPNIQIVARQATGDDANGAVRETENILSAHPNVKAIIGLSQECIPGAAPTLKRLNKTNIILAGFDDSPESEAAVKDGTCAFFVAQRTYTMGVMSLEKLLDASQGKTLDKQYDTGTDIVTKANVDTFKKDEMEKLTK